LLFGIQQDTTPDCTHLPASLPDSQLRPGIIDVERLWFQPDLDTLPT